MSSKKITPPTSQTSRTSPPQTSKEKLKALTETLDNLGDEESLDDAETTRETVAKLGVNIHALASDIRAKIAAADNADKASEEQGQHHNVRERIFEARAAYAKEVERLEHRKVEPERTREEQLVIFEALLKKAPPHTALGMHFHKYEAASKEELAELIRGLRYLLGDEDDDA